MSQIGFSGDYAKLRLTLDMNEGPKMVRWIDVYFAFG